MPSCVKSASRSWPIASPANDYLPDPDACLITGITPQECLAKGEPEAAFAARIERLLAEPGTIGVGYNTIRFDDEVTRFLFWRNLIDPYAREWQERLRPVGHPGPGARHLGVAP
jgi:exonuclease I